MSEEKQSAPARSSEQDQLLDHQYDGIQEYDNPMPRWWVYIFWATIVFSILYFMNLPGIGSGKGRIANYERDLAAARAAHPAPVAAADLTDESLRGMTKVASEVEEGHAVFLTNCVPCHRPDGGGSIGPNHPDAYFLHGGRPTEVLRTVHDGVLAKGMPAWGQVLKPDQVTAVAVYVLTLKGTHPPDPKGPEGMNADSLEALGGGTK
jgi:cytochrome c oxidase cbb3-type subunit 3